MFVLGKLHDYDIASHAYPLTKQISQLSNCDVWGVSGALQSAVWLDATWHLTSCLRDGCHTVAV